MIPVHPAHKPLIATNVHTVLPKACWIFYSLHTVLMRPPFYRLHTRWRVRSIQNVQNVSERGKVNVSEQQQPVSVVLHAMDPHHGARYIQQTFEVRKRRCSSFRSFLVAWLNSCRPFATVSTQRDDTTWLTSRNPPLSSATAHVTLSSVTPSFCWLYTCCDTWAYRKYFVLFLNKLPWGYHGDKQGDIKELDPRKAYKYLGIEESFDVQHKNEKENLKKEYLRRLQLVLGTELSVKNKILAIGSLAVPVLRYSFGIVNWHQEELQKLHRKTGKLLNIHGQHHP